MPMGCTSTLRVRGVLLPGCLRWQSAPCWMGTVEEQPGSQGCMKADHVEAICLLSCPFSALLHFI